MIIFDSKLDSFVFNNTIGPSREYYFMYKYADSLNRSAFGSKLAIFSNCDDSLVYYNPLVYAHELHDPQEIEESRKNIDVPGVKRPLHSKLLLATWSEIGNVLYVLEYAPSYPYFPYNKYSDIFIDLDERTFVRSKYGVISDEDATRLKFRKSNFIYNDVKDTLKGLGCFNPQPLVSEIKPLTYFTRNILKRNKWYM